MNTMFKKVSEKVYLEFCRFFPFSCVDFIIIKNNAILLTKRTRDPYKGRWHLPGSIIRKHERMKDAVIRSAKQELDLNVKIKKYVGVYESLNSFRHDVSHCYLVSIVSGKIKLDFQSHDMKFFKNIPQRTLPHHIKMIKDAKKILSEKKAVIEN